MSHRVRRRVNASMRMTGRAFLAAGRNNLVSANMIRQYRGGEGRPPSKQFLRDQKLLGV